MIDPRRIEVIDDATVEALRRLTPAERIARGLSLGAFARGVISANVRRMHPDWDEARVAAETRKRFAGGR